MASTFRRPRLRTVLVLPFALSLSGSAACVPEAEFDPQKPITQKVQDAIRSGTESFSHDGFDVLLKAVVQSSGRVDYAALKKRHAELKKYLDQLAAVELPRLSRDHLLALLVNAYNAYTLDLIVSNYPTKSIKSLSKPWDTPFCKLGGESVTLNDIENKLLRPKELFSDPRIHFAINCASIGCPLLRPEAYKGDRIELQLADSARRCLADPRYLQVDGEKVRVSSILNWFAGDFREKHGSVAQFLVPYAPPEAKALLAKGDEVLAYLDYDWGLNDVEKTASP